MASPGAVFGDTKTISILIRDNSGLTNKEINQKNTYTMKKALLTLMCLATMMAAGMGLKAQEVTITLKPGWTWIGIPNTDTLDFATAFGSFTPAEGDMIRSQYAYTEYDEGEWFGGLKMFYPGYGYLYYSNRTEPVTLTFNVQQPTPQVVVTTSEPTNINGTSAVAGGTVTIGEGNHVFVRGVCWGTEEMPTVDGSHTSDDAVAGSQTVTLVGLNPVTTYYVRAYAVTDYGLAYGEEQSFTTESHDYVNLGLPSGTLWATCNVGADTSEGYGDYFAWGETQPKENYSWNTYQFFDGTTILTKYDTDGLVTLLPEDDAATANWGTDWCMPADWQLRELYLNTTVTWTTQNGVNGQLFTASNGNSIFLPAAGYRYGSSLLDVGSYGDYWSSSRNTDTPRYAWYLWFDSDYKIMYSDSQRRCGLSVRPVRVGSQSNVPLGAIDGKFTINGDGDQVYFSQGNLQYIGSAGDASLYETYWKFAEHQWDYLGTTTGQNSSNGNVDRDLFGWGTSGYDHGAVCWQPWSTNETDNNYWAYDHNYDNLYDESGQADWGYNPISNGGSALNAWRTLSLGEWGYIFNDRQTESGIRYAKAQVNGVNGVILLPDDWNSSTYSLNNTNNYAASFNSNTLTASEWSTLEQAGAVFLPAAGYRNGDSVGSAGSGGNYWSASWDDSTTAYRMYFTNSFLDTDYYARHYGFSVRLVRDVE